MGGSRNSLAAQGRQSVTNTEAQPLMIKPMQQRMEEQKQYIAEQMGREVYEKVLRILMIHKQNDSDSSDIQETLKPIMGKNRKMKDLCFALEMLVWKEM